MLRFACIALVGLVVSGAALATGTATIYLESPAAGQTVAPGTAIAWSIKVAVSTGDNLGLALISADLVQDPNNPAKFDIPPANAATIPTLLSGFNRPGGITNPGEGGAPSGFIGVQRLAAGQTYKNLIQIGGGQNTFGQAGTGFGTDPNVESGIGQSGQQLVISGTFNAPATDGAYTFRLENVLANVLTTLNTPPDFSQVSAATVNTSSAAFSFTVSSGPVACIGDTNCDGFVNFGDINPFVGGLTGGPMCNPLNFDINGNGSVGFDDINPFVAVLSGGGGPCAK